ncbi:MAG: hypothetical protein R3A78_15670 [Polyangiales bacterium]|nr:hypothetical protein [Myxococcales bacterium]
MDDELGPKGEPGVVSGESVATFEVQVQDSVAFALEGRAKECLREANADWAHDLAVRRENEGRAVSDGPRANAWNMASKVLAPSCAASFGLSMSSHSICCCRK